MSKKAFPINRVNIDPPKPVRVAPNPPIALPEREPRNIWVMIGVPALIVALIGTIVMLYVSGVRSLATGFFPLMGIGAFSMLAFSGRFGRARKITWGELEKGRRRYLRDLDTNRDEIQTAVCAQREWQNAVHSDPPGLGAIIGGPRMWERGRGDVDFLEVRVGTGVQHAPDSVLSVTWPDISSDEELEPVTGQALRDFILEQRKIRDIAKVVNLRSAPGFSFVSEDLDRVRSLMRSVLCSLAVFHNPRDVKLMVVTRNPEVWAWMVWLPHNLHDELFDACGWRRLIFATPEELEAALGAELHMKGKRGAWTPPTVASQPALSSIVAAAAHTEYDTGLSLSAVCALEPYWEALRKVYAPFESGLPGPTGRVYHHEIPGGQLSNLRQQAIALGLGDRFEEIEEAYAGADRVLGRLVKVTPTSKVVGDLALALVGAGVSADEFASDPARFGIPESVLGFLRGELGDPPGGWPEPLRTAALAGRGAARPTAQLAADDEIALSSVGAKRQATLNRLLFPSPTKEFNEHREAYGDTSQLSANQFFYGLRQGEEHRVKLERGVELLIGLEAISEPDERGMRTVMCILNGQLRPVLVRDRSIASAVPAAEKADRGNPGHIAAPFAGVVTVGVCVGERVGAGQTIATIEAMKMEAPITAPVAGTVERVAVSDTAQVEGGDLLVVVS